MGAAGDKPPPYGGDWVYIVGEDIILPQTFPKGEGLL